VKERQTFNRIKSIPIIYVIILLVITIALVVSIVLIRNTRVNELPVIIPTSGPSQNNNIISTITEPAIVNGVVTLVISSSLAPARANYNCTGVNDNEVFQKALDALPANGGRLEVLAGPYFFSATVSRVIDNVSIEGSGHGTIFVSDVELPLFSTSNTSGWSFKNLNTDNGGIDFYASTNYTLENVSLNGIFFANKSAQDIQNQGTTVNMKNYVIAANNASDAQKAAADLVCPGGDIDKLIQFYINESAGGTITLTGNFTKNQPTGFLVPSNTTIELNGSIKFADNINHDGCIFTNSDFKNGNTNIAILGGTGALLDGNEVNQSSGIQCGVIFKNISGLTVDLSIKAFRTLDMQINGSCSNVSRNNRFYRQGNELDTQTIDDMSNVTVWQAVNGTIVSDPDYHALGSSSIKFTNSSHPAYMTRHLDKPLDLSNKQFRIWAKLDPNNYSIYTDDTDIRLAFLSGEKTATAYLTDFLALSDTVNGFHYLDVPRSAFEYTNAFSDSDWSNITDIQLIPSWKTSIPFTTYWGGLEMITQPQQPVVSLSWDDGHVSVFTDAAPIAKKYNMPLVLAIIGNIPDSGITDMTWDQIKELYALNYDICSHPHPDFKVMSDSQEILELQQTKNTLLAYGFDRGNSFLVIPDGSYKRTWSEYQLMRSYYSLIRTIGGDMEMSGYMTQPTTSDGRLVTSFELTGSAACEAAKIRVLNTARCGGWEDFFCHTLGISNTDAWGEVLEISDSDWDSFLAFLYDYGIPVKTWSQIAESTGIPVNINQINGSI